MVVAGRPARVRPALLPLCRVNHVVGIEPERIIAGGPRQRRVAGRGEVINPDEIKHPCAELFSDLPRAIFRPRVNHHDLVEQAANGAQAGRKVLLFIPYDHRETHGGRRPLGTNSCLDTGPQGHALTANPATPTSGRTSQSSL